MKTDISPSRASTQGMVAARAGVSQVTVSHILSGKGENYHADTREKVRRAAEELGYRPNRHARAMRNGKTGLIALINAGDVGLIYQLAQRKMRAAAEAIVRENYEPLVQENYSGSNREGNHSLATVQRAIDARVEGVILIHPTPPLFGEEHLAPLLKAGIPTVSLSMGDPEGIPLFYSKREWGYHALARHLLDLGYRHLGVLGDGTPSIRVGVERAVAEHPAKARVQHGSPRDIAGPLQRAARDYLRGKAGMEEILTWKSRPDAVLCGNDAWAQGALTACTEAGLRVPHDLALTGFDDDISSAFGAVPLTTVAQPIEAIAQAAVQHLLRMIRKGLSPQPEEFCFPGTVIVRRSCGAFLRPQNSTM